MASTWRPGQSGGLRDRIRAGDVWVAGSRHYRDVEDQLISANDFNEMRTCESLPLSVELDASAYLQARRDEFIGSFPSFPQRLPPALLRG